MKKAGVPVPKGGTVLLCTGHHERTFPRKEYSTDNSGINVAGTEWLAKQGVVHFGIDSMRPGPEGKVNSLVHKACSISTSPISRACAIWKHCSARASSPSSACR